MHLFLLTTRHRGVSVLLSQLTKRGNAAASTWPYGKQGNADATAKLVCYKSTNSVEIKDATNLSQEECTETTLQTTENVTVSNKRGDGKSKRSSGEDLRSLLKGLSKSKPEKKFDNITELLPDVKKPENSVKVAPLVASPTNVVSKEEPSHNTAHQTDKSSDLNTAKSTVTVKFAKRLKLRDVIKKKTVGQDVPNELAMPLNELVASAAENKDVPKELEVFPDDESSEIKATLRRTENEEQELSASIRDLLTRKSNTQVCKSSLESKIHVKLSEDQESGTEDMAGDDPLVGKKRVGESLKQPMPQLDTHTQISSLRQITRTRARVLQEIPRASDIDRSQGASSAVSDFFVSDITVSKSSEPENVGREFEQKKTPSTLDDLIAAQNEVKFEMEHLHEDTSQQNTFKDDGLHLVGFLEKLREKTGGHDFSKGVMESVVGRTPQKIMTSLPAGELFHGPKLGFFSRKLVTPRSHKEFVSTHEKDYLKLLKSLALSKEPANGFEAEMQKSDKVWPLPVDNEICKVNEDDVGFEEHVFLDYLLEDFPQIPAIQQFMELVINGLQQNPHLTVDQKKNKVNWFRDYFSQFSQEDLVDVKEMVTS